MVLAARRPEKDALDVLMDMLHVVLLFVLIGALGVNAVLVMRST